MGKSKHFGITPPSKKFSETSRITREKKKDNKVIDIEKQIRKQQNKLGPKNMVG